MYHEIESVYRVQRSQTEIKDEYIILCCYGHGFARSGGIDIEIDMNEVRLDLFCSSGPGGQSVNTTIPVRLTHIPTELSGHCQDQKSQHKNKEKLSRCSAHVCTNSNLAES